MKKGEGEELKYILEVNDELNKVTSLLLQLKLY